MNIQNEHGATVLMFAASHNSADVARLLLAASADVNARDNDNVTALTIATDFDSADVAELLNAAGAR